jgi:two-component system CheB/CheR fusion protein
MVNHVECPDNPAEEAVDSKKTDFCCVVGIGASAGGVEVFRTLLQNLPPNLGFSYVLILHLDPHHKSILTSILSTQTFMPVTEVFDGLEVVPNHVYVVPPNKLMTIKEGELHLSPRIEGRNLPIDHFFESLAVDQKEKSIGIILSGTASDGTIGCSAIKAAGGITIAQEHAKFDGMPSSAIASGCVDFILPVEDIPGELHRLGSHPYLSVTEARTKEEALFQSKQHLEKIFGILRKATSIDFSLYKQTTIKRRLMRRLLVRKTESLVEYAQYLEKNPGEITALIQDLLINVTQFFRDPEMFEYLKVNIFPRIIENRGRDEPIRIWAAGCSTGEEAYSLAIALWEFLDRRTKSFPIQIFGTDLNDAGIQKARAGIYGSHTEGHVSKERLDRFFLKVGQQYQIIKPIRDLCVFASQNLAKDPPFSRMDLISCRNLLIYFEPTLQKRVMPTFHYALKPNGFLILGASESVGLHSDLFSPLDSRHKIFARKSGHGRFYLPLSTPEKY